MLKDWHVVGAKIICVFLPKCWAAGEIFPLINNVYTIRNVLIWQDSVYFQLAEIRNDHLDYARYEKEEEISFDADCFRPVVSRPTDISVFEKLLTSPEVREMVGHHTCRRNQENELLELVEKVG